MSQNILLVDSNVWLDSYLPERTGYDAARNFFHAVTKRYDIALTYAVTSITDVFYIATRSLKRQRRMETGTLSEADALAINEIAWGYIRNMQDVATAIGANDTDVRTATKYRGMSYDFEDDMVMALAQRSGARYLVTNDEGLLRRCVVASITPADMTSLLALDEPL